MLNKADVKKILIIKLRGIGDVVLSTLTFDTLQRNFPNAKIDFLTEKPSNFLLEPLNPVNQIFLFRKKTLTERLNTFYTIRKQKYDLILDFYSNPGTAQLTFFSGAKYRAGFPYKGRKYAYNLFGPRERDKYHAATLHLEFLRSIGLEVVENSKLTFGMLESEVTTAEKFRENLNLGNKKLIGISPSGGWQSKKCPAKVFVKIAKKIEADFGDVFFLIHWGPGDEEDAEYIHYQLKENSVLAPKTSIREMGAYLKICDAVIANDSGPMHICSAVGTPILGLFGPTSPKFQGPFGEQNNFIQKSDLFCIECNLLTCKYKHECFYDLPVEAVSQKFGELLSKNKIVY